MTQRYKTKAELNSKTIRVSLSQYALLTEIALKAGVSISEALGLALEKQGEVTREIHMPIQRIAVARGITVAKSLPIHMARSTPMKISFSREVKSGYRYRQTNGH